ncbi:adenine phosphoribosyltransferase [Pseudonocardia hierapolitana]|uniref:Adenine phosphoribosyltransferase n=1 Tax=Pseudonocardia hierapolitana TaxID=1128676 RepID=A0A561T1E4_9PSEU|nr:adenine phosphoribosyltransferase [Pseudonocardia hierapolitana]
MTGPVTDPGPVPVAGGEPELERVAGLVRDVPDYPSPGILFRDITPVLADAEAFTAVTTELAALVGEADLVAGVEARGFLLGAAVAVVAGTGVVTVRKAGKLPRVAASRTYELEYGTATLELPADTVARGARVFLVDDVLATGGTAAAAAELLREVGATVVGFGALLELTALNGRARLGDVPVHALLTA